MSSYPRERLGRPLHLPGAWVATARGSGSRRASLRVVTSCCWRAKTLKALCPAGGSDSRQVACLAVVGVALASAATAARRPKTTGFGALDRGASDAAHRGRITLGAFALRVFGVSDNLHTSTTPTACRGRPRFSPSCRSGDYNPHYFVYPRSLHVHAGRRLPGALFYAGVQRRRDEHRQRHTHRFLPGGPSADRAVGDAHRAARLLGGTPPLRYSGGPRAAAFMAANSVHLVYSQLIAPMCPLRS